MGIKRISVFGLVAALITGCAGQSPTQNLAAETAVGPAPSGALDVSGPAACDVALVRTGAFSLRTVEALASLRPLVVARDFNSAETLEVVRRLSALMVADAALPKLASQCETTAALGPDIEAIQIGSARPIETGLFASLNDPALLRSAAVDLWKLLPSALELQALVQGIASGQGTDIAVATIPDGAGEPLGKLPPITTASASPSPTPTPTSGTGDPPTGTSPPKWASTANAFKASVFETYGKDVPNAISELWGYAIFVPGLTRAEIDARKEEARLIFKPAVASIKAHLSFMDTHPAAGCFVDAYRADRAIAKTWLAYLPSFNYPNDLTGGGRAATAAWTEALSTMERFVARLPGYFSDCEG